MSSPPPRRCGADCSSPSPRSSCSQAAPWRSCSPPARRRLAPRRRVHDADDDRDDAPEPETAGGRRLPVADLRLRRRPHARLQRRARLPAPALQARLDLPQRGADRVPARDRGRVALPARRRRHAARDRRRRAGAIRWRQQVGRLAAASPAVGDGRVYAVALRGIASETRPHRRLWRPRRPPGVVEGAAEPCRVLPAAAQRPRLLRHRGRHRLCARREDRPHDLDVPRRRRGQGRARARERNAVLRRLRRQSPRRAARATAAGVVGRHERDALRLRLGTLLLDRRGRVRARLHRQHRQPRLLVRRQQRQARVGDRNGRLRLRLARGRHTSRARPDGLHRLLRRQLLRVRRALGHGALALPPGAKISGSATIVGDVVYFSNLSSDDTEGLDVRSGKKVFEFSDGAFNAVVADRRASTSPATRLRDAAQAPDAGVARRTGGAARRDLTENRAGRGPPREARSWPPAPSAAAAARPG